MHCILIQSVANYYLICTPNTDADDQKVGIEAFFLYEKFITEHMVFEVELFPFIQP